MIENKKVGRYIAKLLRHDPDDLEMDSEGYVLTIDLLKKLNISKIELDFIVETNDKKRFAYNKEHTKIRASQGHSKSVEIEIEMKESDRIDFLYHGTSSKNINSILKIGLHSGNRKHVHLSKDLETATKVGQRHGKDVVVFKIDSAKMRADGIKIWISDNGVYLTDFVNPKYLSVCQ